MQMTLNIKIHEKFYKNLRQSELLGIFIELVYL